MNFYDPKDWHWCIGGNTKRYWSSKQAAYVDALPDDAGVTNIVSEDELWEVLREQAPSGLPKDLVSKNLPDLTPRQFLLAAYDIGVTEAMIMGLIGNDEIAMIEWKHATSIKRSHPLVAALSHRMDLPPEHLDAM